jgi:hypothetical protein
VQLTGALLGVNTSENSVELVRRITARSGGPCYSIYAPQVLPDAKAAASLRQQPEVSEAYRRFGTVTKAVVAIGSWDPPRSQLYDSLPERQRTALRRKGVLAEVGAVLLDADGTEVATDFTERCISISGRQLRDRRGGRRGRRDGQSRRGSGRDCRGLREEPGRRQLARYSTAGAGGLVTHRWQYDVSAARRESYAAVDTGSPVPQDRLAETE